jgi:hypothetical protein
MLNALMGGQSLMREFACSGSPRRGQAYARSLDVMAELKSRYANMIGDKPLTAILRGLSAFVAQTEKI